MTNEQHGPDEIDDNILKTEWFPKVFPIEEFKVYLGQSGFNVLECGQTEGQTNTWDLKLGYEHAGLTEPALKRQLTQLVNKIPINPSVDNSPMWRIDVLAVVMTNDGQTGYVQFRVTDSPHLQ